MLIQSGIVRSPLQHNHVSLAHSLSFPAGFPSSAFLRTVRARKPPMVTVRCSISQVHSYGTVDYEGRPPIKWNAVYRRISMMEDPEMGSATVLNQCEKEGKRLTKWELCRVVRQLRKFRRYKPALEVYEWMNNKKERFRTSTTDTAIQLDLIAKVQGIISAENFFLKLPDTLKDNRTYGALLNAYVRAQMREQAESLMEKMRDRGYARNALPFNVIMTLYLNLKDYDKVDLVVSQMEEENIPLDIYSYNIWLSSCGYQGSVGKMEHVFLQMKLDRTINPNWTTFSTMASMYIKLGQMEKAEDCLKKVETRITGRNRISYHYLISLYGGVGLKEEVYRIWNIYKSIFPSISNLGYHTMISSLIRLGDIRGAEQIFEEWLLVKSTYDPRIVNLLMGWYVREGLFEKAKGLFDEMVEGGGKANSSTWEILAEGHIRGKRISEALSCLKEAVLVERSKTWKPKPANICSILKLCEQEGDSGSKDYLVGLLRQTGFLDDEAYEPYIL
ncbi:pentatricopeptide repeat-containing protein At1g02150-like [Diospyros lotus]|uniref:pentatricopeptide repeat-containing protein At1g02150-like n=1 Tax=Diospyros lotus TaxID=55363 RepID=UPI00225853F3|nr:pentatricopeptide repeat-containing protein At1g02150-like [Diospyros lotus]